MTRTTVKSTAMLLAGCYELMDDLWHGDNGSPLCARWEWLCGVRSSPNQCTWPCGGGTDLYRCPRQ